MRSPSAEKKRYTAGTRGSWKWFSPKESAKDYDGRRFVVDQDAESKILVKIRVFDRDDQLVEEYGYENQHLNAPLTDADFDPNNPEYHF